MSDRPEGARFRSGHRARILEAIRFEIRPFGRDPAIGYLGGPFAADSEAMTASAMERLAEAFDAGIRRHLTGAVAAALCGGPNSGGAAASSPRRAARAHLWWILTALRWPAAGRRLVRGSFSGSTRVIPQGPKLVGNTITVGFVYIPSNAGVCATATRNFWQEQR